MQTILSYSINDLIVDADSVAAVVTDKAVSLSSRIDSVCQIEDKVSFILLPNNNGEQERYFIVDFPEEFLDYQEGEIFERWKNGFRLVGVIKIEARQYLAIYGEY